MLKLSSALVALIFMLFVLADSLELHDLEKRQENIKIYRRKRNAHACIMSIVFCVLYPLGAISIHLPIDKIPGLRNTYLRNKVTAIHVPIQAIATVLLIGAFGLGIHLGQFQGYFTKQIPYHMVIGIIVVAVILIFQPILGSLQHSYYKKHGKKSMFAYAHRWIGRGAIILGIINDAFGLDLYGEAPKSSYIRNFTIAGLLVLIWFSLAMIDMFRARGSKTGPVHKETDVIASGSPHETDSKA